METDNAYYQYENRKNRLTFTDAIFLVYAIFNLFPDIKNIVGNYAIIGLIGIWLLMKSPAIGRCISGWGMALIIWVIIGSVICLLNSNITILKNYIADLINLVFPFIYYSVERYNTEKIKKIFWYLIVLTTLSLTYGFYQTLLISRERMYYRSSESYAVTYVAVVFSLVLIRLFTYRRNMGKIRTVFVLLSIILMVLGVYQSGFFIAQIALIVGVILIFTINSSFSRTKKLIIIIITTILSIIIYSSLLDILLWLQNTMTNHYYVEKINDIIQSISGGNSVNTFVARADRYDMSIQAIMSSPILGCIWKIHGSTVTDIASIIGYHSTILDNFALFGVALGLIPNLIIFHPIFRVCKEYRINNGLAYSMLITMLIILLLDNMIPALGIVAYYMLYTIYTGKNL